MKSLRNTILSAMTGNEFSNTTFSLSVLYLLSRLYGWGVGLRSSIYDAGFVRQKKLPCRVISIGNLTVGGTGKTPMTIYVARMLQDLGLRTAVISRGYKGAMERQGGIVSDGKTVFSGVETAGDEPLMMARSLRGIPVIVGRNRFNAGMLAIRDFSADVVVLDDGFQHRRLHRDVDLVLIDDKTFLGNGHLLPRGILREPPSVLARSHACVLTRSPKNPTGHFENLHQMFPGKEIFRAFHTPYIHGLFPEDPHDFAKQSPLVKPGDFSFLRNSSVFIFSGIAKNKEFQEMVKEKVKSVRGCREYPDHHFYTRGDMENIIGLAGQSGAEAIITTEKDFSRLGGRIQIPSNLVVIGVKISFGEDGERFSRFIQNRVQ
ncbi:MAG: tetraacyldisaccharide 4'-kinase [Desulfobacterales bacterium]|nr:tetraacyldisaccharide 4'-kinase [Desulfobacterales bacterium]